MKYEIRESEDNEQVVYVINTTTHQEVGDCDCLEGCVELVKDLLQNYLNQEQHDETQEYEEIGSLLANLFYYYTHTVPPFKETEEGHEDTVSFFLKFHNVLSEAINLEEKINNLLHWYFQKPVGPFCFILRNDAKNHLAVRLEECEGPQIFLELFEAENFFLRNLHAGKITETIYNNLIHSSRKVFSQIKKN